MGRSWGPLGALLGLSWGPLGSPGGPLGAILEAIDQKTGFLYVSPPSWAIKMASWGALGALLGRSWALLG
eukprot:264567-Pyramimonas_sp.AAC.1